MTYDALQIANWFIRRAGMEDRKLSIMSVLKLTYIAHGWHLEIRKEPLFDNRIEAWQYGPVIPDVYRKFRTQGITVSTPYPTMEAELHANDERFLNGIWDIYGNLSASRLSELTHEESGPWHIVTQAFGNYVPIPNDLIQNHYEMKRSRNVDLRQARNDALEEADQLVNSLWKTPFISDDAEQILRRAGKGIRNLKTEEPK